MFKLKNVKFLDVLNIKDLEIKSNRLTVITGPSGSGKSTLLKLLNKMISPDEGQILFKGKDISKIDSVKLRRQVPMLSQTVTRYEGSVRDNLTKGIEFQKQDFPDDKSLKKALEDVGLDKDLDEDIGNLSGGEAQRVAIARLALLNRDVYLLDEPSSALDTETEDFVIRTFIENLGGKTLIYVTHSEDLAEKYADDIVHIVGGEVVD